ncbi:hypothetical protein [Exilibacterium tricleocarpae]|uniref:hypothetical protein n=1 Tax=Exilibacterium tricleocarpae TaxID=2591008 RepID=UPI001C555275|nr:hypothetical protein [Exilibacterium tricleocarpae]
MPASALGEFYPSLLAYFVITCGLSFLETTANPYILSMGPQETATRRLNLAQAFNPIGSLIGMYTASQFILAQLDARQRGPGSVAGRGVRGGEGGSDKGVAAPSIGDGTPATLLLKRAQYDDGTPTALLLKRTQQGWHNAVNFNQLLSCRRPSRPQFQVV